MRVRSPQGTGPHILTVALMNRSTSRVRPPEQTRPRLLPVSPVLHAHDGSHGAAGVSPRALRCSIHLHAGPRHARPARPSCGSPGRWVRTVCLRQTTTPPFTSQLFRSPSGASQLDPLAPEGWRSLPPWKRGAVSISPWWIPPPQRVRCPRNRVNSSPGNRPGWRGSPAARCSPPRRKTPPGGLIRRGAMPAAPHRPRRSHCRC